MTTRVWQTWCTPRPRSLIECKRTVFLRQFAKHVRELPHVMFAEGTFMSSELTCIPSTFYQQQSARKKYSVDFDSYFFQPSLSSSIKNQTSRQNYHSQNILFTPSINLGGNSLPKSCNIECQMQNRYQTHKHMPSIYSADVPKNKFTKSSNIEQPT